MRVSLLLAGALALLAALAQVLLPRIAAGRISSRVGRYGHVVSVSVSAWPAVELLWGDADSVTVRAGALALSPAQASALLWEGRGAARMDVSAATVRLGPLALDDATLRKRGSSLSALALTTQAQVRDALPAGVGVRLLDSVAGQVQVEVRGGLFGIGASVQAVAQPRQGTLIAHPVGALLEGFQLTLFSDRHVYVEAIGAGVARRSPLTYALTMQASLR